MLAFLLRKRSNEPDSYWLSSDQLRILSMILQILRKLATDSTMYEENVLTTVTMASGQMARAAENGVKRS